MFAVTSIMGAAVSGFLGGGMQLFFTVFWREMGKIDTSKKSKIIRIQNELQYLRQGERTASVIQSGESLAEKHYSHWNNISCLPLVIP